MMTRSLSTPSDLPYHHLIQEHVLLLLEEVAHRGSLHLDPCQWTCLISGYYSAAAVSSSHLLANHNHNHTCNHLRKKSSRSPSVSAHGLHMLTHSDSRHHHFFEILMHFLQVPPPLANCSSLEVTYTDPGLQAMIYM